MDEEQGMWNFTLLICINPMHSHRPRVKKDTLWLYVCYCWTEFFLYGSTSKLRSSVVEHLNHLLKDNRSNCSKIIGKKTSTSLQLKRYPYKYISAYWFFITLPCVHTKTIVFRINKQNFLILSLLGLNLHELPLQVLTLRLRSHSRKAFFP